MQSVYCLRLRRPNNEDNLENEDDLENQSSHELKIREGWFLKKLGCYVVGGGNHESLLSIKLARVKLPR